MSALKVVLALASAVMSCAVPANQQDRQAFIEMMVSKHQFDPSYIEQTLATASKSDTILEAIARPWEAKPWYQYYPIFLTEKRIKKGVEFWQQHEDILNRAEKELGVDPAIVTAIIGVETFYGTYKGKYSVLDALYTLGFYYPPRAKFFRSELEQFFLLLREEQLPTQELKGSYAGAMGWGQFISSSYRHYAIDFDGDGVRDLLNNPVDAIGSVANYFKAHGWQAGQPVAYPARVTDKSEKLINKDLKFTRRWQDLQQSGVTLHDESVTVASDSKAKLLEFELAEGAEYWVGLPNFYVITRYNHSPLYAMAVYQLSQRIRDMREG
ncbi:lytic murein transglycosylase B [Aestuariibacter salexigens]|uniref:lytic murein transglycosylase B n=1 Tax=Aestuariibacter salexigens TaxID=226010 RepID=UPI000411D434|nr:lytic murein transglycosylase B [Aestuariibacter salexigens]